MAQYTIKGPNTTKWEITADKYTLQEGFFHFYNWDNDQLFSVKAELVKTIEAANVATSA